ncbi:16S rRNA (cytosine(1402)-N(4))-methyltransferase RsmH [Pontiella agarivorans]|uniref:Ribosomal RNA small subunit methyltransferase H n=1 Tax=Pontiella agarivorans TaxID=3038953 RepID=A0ABU5MSE4_9BACT|nr:16S rRNA (cytosine(1402)-N(4))-methyltransferase RsmH [Pontiella agarivorans]MDZ8117115.1 16S rRNA (cytosine(1402)-N(4))-methyltransferase RsmH [Pontiella agarivorans]
MHIPVMLNECLEALITDPAGVYVDGTLGNGGHSAEILKRLSDGGTLIGFDRDIEAIERVQKKLFSGEGKRVELVHDNYANMALQLDRLGVEKVDGLLLDLGVSSFQLDVAGRGFSFQQDAPIDMRMDQTQGRTAGELVNHAPEAELADIIYRYGEEKASRRIARAIAEARVKKEIETTLELAAIVERAKGGRKGKKTHPATKTFQALRMAVNDELAGIEQVLETMIENVVEGGRIVVLTFHSLEDRMVKRFFARHVPREESLQQGGVKRIYDEPPVKWIWKKPLTATEEEQAVNPRSRSAKLRAVEVGV